MALDFTSIPILDFSQTKSPATKPIFLAELQNALVKVGFFYIKNHAIPEDIQTELIRSSVQFFDLPTEKKLEVDMVNSRHYFGYVRVGNEKSSGKIDYRETFTLGMDNPAPGPNDPLYCNMLGPGQWPDESSIPGFGQAVRNYISAVHHLADEFKVLVAEALDLEPTALLSFFNDRPGDRFKLIKYPQPSSISSQGGENEGQDAFSGIGPHKDGTFLTFLLQGTPHSGLEIQNKRGEWIPALPIPGTLVVNIGRMFEALTGGICTATTHRVNLREENFMDGAGNLLGPRYSFPMFLPFRLDLAESEMPLKIPDHIADYVRGEKVESDARGMSQAVYNVRVGDGVFMGSAIKHPRVAHRWYPEILARSQAASV